MEVKINREIRDYQESIFFGLNLRQLIFSILAIGVAVGIYFGLNNVLGTETVSWMCILGAAPFAALGFIRYNGMNAEEFIGAYIKSEWLMPKHLCFEGENVYCLALTEAIENRRPDMQDERYQNKPRKELALAIEMIAQGKALSIIHNYFNMHRPVDGIKYNR